MSRLGKSTFSIDRFDNVACPVKRSELATQFKERGKVLDSYGGDLPHTVDLGFSVRPRSVVHRELKHSQSGSLSTGVEFPPEALSKEAWTP